MEREIRTAAIARCANRPTTTTPASRGRILKGPFDL